MNKKRSWGSMVLILISMNAMTQTYSLQDCIHKAFENNLTVAQAGVQAERSKINYDQARTDQLPNINGNIGQSINLGRSIDPFTNSYTTQEINATGLGLNAGLLLFNGWSLQSNIRQNQLAWKSAQQSLQQQKDNIALTVVLAYLQLLASEEQLEQVKNQLTVSKEQLDRLKILDAQGAIKPSELSDLTGQFHNDEIALNNAKNTIISNKINLCKLLNIPYKESFAIQSLADPLPLDDSPSANEIYQTALEHLALIKTTGLLVQSARWNVKALQGSLWPRLSFNANVNTNYSSVATNSIFAGSGINESADFITMNGINYPVFKPYNNYNNVKIPYFDQIKNNRYTSLSLNLSIPIFNSLSARNNIRAAKTTLKERELVHQNNKTNLQLDVEHAYANKKTAKEEYRLITEQVNAYVASFKAAEARLNEGVGTSVDYIIAKNNVDRANSNLITSKYTLLLRGQILDFYQGKILW